jgi:CHAD domain-containing protein
VAFAIDPEKDETLASGARRIARSQLHIAHEALAQGDVYESRKALKRVRALLRMLKPAAPKLQRRENDALREVGRALSPIRDADAAIEAVDALLDAHEGNAALIEVRDWLVARRDALRVDAAAVLAQTRTIVEQALARAESWDIPNKGFRKLIEPGLRLSYGRGRALLVGAERKPTLERLHEFRKRVKDHRDQARMLVYLWPEMMNARQEQITVLSRALGLDRDLAAVDDLLTEATDLDPAHRAGARLHLFTKRVELEAIIWPLAHRVYAEPPDVVGRQARRLSKLVFSR